MKQYPNAYCVKCGNHTHTQNKHTVILQSNARALHGKCPECGSDVFKFLPKKQMETSKKTVLTPSKNELATVTSIHEVRMKRRASDNSDMRELENRVLSMQKKQPIDYALVLLGVIASFCVLYILFR